MEVVDAEEVGVVRPATAAQEVHHVDPPDLAGATRLVVGVHALLHRRRQRKRNKESAMPPKLATAAIYLRRTPRGSLANSCYVRPAVRGRTAAGVRRSVRESREACVAQDGS